MSKKIKYPPGYDSFWGDGEPYSQVNLTHQVRIIGPDISREFYHITANINPGTYDLLVANAKKLPQPVVTDFLKNSDFVSLEKGYEWVLYAREILGDEDTEKMLREAANKVITLHKIVLPLIK